MPKNVQNAVANYKSKDRSSSARVVDPNRLKRLAQKCQAIQKLHEAYIVHGLTPELVGREFFIAVGDILRGVPPDKLEVFHLQAN